MTRKFRFLGYGSRQPYLGDGDYEDMDADKEYWFSAPVFTVGKVYEALSVTKGYTLPDDAYFIDDEGDEMTQELQFFEEVFDLDTPPEFDENWDNGLVEPDEDELILMDMNAEVLEADFIGE